MEIVRTNSIMISGAVQKIRTPDATTARTGQGDTVTLSSEAKRLLEHFRTMQVTATDRETHVSSETAGTLSDARSESVRRDARAERFATTASASISSDSGSQIEDIRKRIKDLMDKVQHIMDSNLPPEQKQSTAAPYLQQIQELQQQLQQLSAGRPGARRT